MLAPLGLREYQDFKRVVIKRGIYTIFVTTVVTDRPNGATHVRLIGATFRVYIGPSNRVNSLLFRLLFQLFFCTVCRAFRQWSRCPVTVAIEHQAIGIVTQAIKGGSAE